MKERDYPKYTVIMRNYSLEQADKIVHALQAYSDHFAVEVTMNTKGALEILRYLTEKYGETAYIGAGTVRSLQDAKDAVAAGARFVLSPTVFSEEVIAYCQSRHVVTVPGAFSPSEIAQQFALGADIVKVFPANAVGPSYFKDIQAPLGKLPLMAVGGVDQSNYQAFFDKGCQYVGIGSGMFKGVDLDTVSEQTLKAIFETYLQ